MNSLKRSLESAPSLIGLVACTLAMFSLLTPKLVSLQEGSRRRNCQNQLRRVGLGLHNYHSAYKIMPPAVGGTRGGDSSQSNQGRLTGFAALLPFIEQQAAWSQLAKANIGTTFSPMGPSPSFDPKKFKLWSVQFDTFLCPSDPAEKGDYGLRSYVMCYGDGVDGVGRILPYDEDEERELTYVCRGAFVPYRGTRFRDVLDGLSNTMIMSETKIGVGTTDAAARIARGVRGLSDSPSKALQTLARAGRFKSGQSVWGVGRGSRWPEGSFTLNAYTSVLPPNSTSATLFNDPESGCLSASSYHKNGVNVMMCDGAIWFVSDTIDVGDLNRKPVSKKNGNGGAQSPYGVWGAMGTRGGKEIIPSEREANYERMSRY